MRVLITSIVVFFLATVTALLIQNDPGYVVLGRGPWRAETTLTFFIILTLFGFAVLYVVSRFIIKALTLPRRMQAWRRERLAHKGRLALTRGLTLLEEGKWETAEKSLLKYIAHSEAPLLGYLAAARAAQRQGAPERRDNYLRLALESAPDADIAVGLTQAELQLSHHQIEQALATLRHLRQLSPQHSHVLKLLMRVYLEVQDWAQLLELLPLLRKEKVVTDTEAHELETKAYVGQLHAATRAQDSRALHEMWENIPRRLQTQENILLTYIQQLRLYGEDHESEPLLREALKKQWSEPLVQLYGQVAGSDPTKQLAHAEGWLKTHPKNPVLLLTLGRLSLRNRLWGKARGYLESSVGAGGRPEAYKELAGLLEQMDEKDAAMEYYRKGLQLIVEPAVTLPARTNRNNEKLATVENFPLLREFDRRA